MQTINIKIYNHKVKKILKIKQRFLCINSQTLFEIFASFCLVINLFNIVLEIYNN